MHFVDGFGVKRKRVFFITAPGRVHRYTWSISDLFCFPPIVRVLRIKMPLMPIIGVTNFCVDSKSRHSKL